MSDETKLAIDQQASKENRSRSNMIEVACKEYLDKKGELVMKVDVHELTQRQINEHR